MGSSLSRILKNSFDFSSPIVSLNLNPPNACIFGLSSYIALSYAFQTRVCCQCLHLDALHVRLMATISPPC